MTHIGLNAHLLSSKAGYRSAGIHGYIYHTLANMDAVAPADWNFTAMVGAANQTQFEGITMRRSGLDTESPLRRIVWEQALQPFQLGSFDLYHGLAFVSPLLITKPSVITVYDLSFLHYPKVLSTSRRLYLRLFTALSCRRAKRVIAISKSTASDLTASLGIAANKVDVAPPGYDTTIYKPLAETVVQEFRQRRNLPDRFWLFLGTLEPRKNLPMLLNAYAALASEDRLPLILAGGKGWDYEDIFQTIDRHKLANDVHFPGYVPIEELPLWYNSAEVFLYPSVFEGFGIPVLEAMACGTPAIVSDASSLPEVIGKGGVMLPPQAVDQWTEALRRAKHDTEWRKHESERGQQAALRYTWQQTAAQTINSYRRALQ
ncbi:MAG: glycosyltransferase family 4 protein [Chloroflexi bacterium]|nr:glycosyltransferase family 4 protein [Chloroflexota bacterium]MCC6894219.1 glycosyltransferase family 4 protein [Anaerolineae bacterium]